MNMIMECFNSLNSFEEGRFSSPKRNNYFFNDFNNNCSDIIGSQIWEPFQEDQSPSILVQNFNYNPMKDFHENNSINSNNFNLIGNNVKRNPINFIDEDNIDKSTADLTNIKRWNNCWHPNFNDLDNNENKNEDIPLNGYKFVEQFQLKKPLETNKKIKKKPKIKKLFKVTGKKKGRDENNLNKEKNKSEFGRLYDEDNINTKIKIHFTKFNRIIVNTILEEKLKQIGQGKDIEDLQFLPINHLESRKTSKKEIELLQTETIGDVLKSEISPKFSTKDSDLNEKNYNIIKANKNLKIVSEVLGKKFPFFFYKIYRQNQEEKIRYIFNLNEFGFGEDLEFKLPEKVFYEDLLEKNKELKYFEKYKTTMDVCCRKNFTIKENKEIKNFKTRKMKKKNFLVSCGNK